MHSTDPYADIQRLVAQLPDSIEAIRERTFAFVASSDTDLALELLRRAIEAYPDPRLRMALGELLSGMGHHKASMAQMVAILRDEPRNSDALMSLSHSLIECGEYRRAEQMLERALRCGGSPRDAKELMRRILSLTGDTSQHVVRDGDPTEDRTNEREPIIDITGLDIEPLDEQANSTTDVAHPETLERALKQLGQNPHGEETREHSSPIEQQEQPTRERQSTLLGKPNSGWAVGDPRGETAQPSRDSERPGGDRLRAPAMKSGTFSGLDTYDVPEEGEKPQLDDTFNEIPLEEITGDRTFDEFLVDMGVPLESDDASGYQEPEDTTTIEPIESYVRPDDTSVVFQDDGQAADASDHTAALIFEDERLESSSGSQPPPVGGRDSAGSGHSPPSDLDDLPSFDEDRGDYRQNLYQNPSGASQSPGFSEQDAYPAAPPPSPPSQFEESHPLPPERSPSGAGSGQQIEGPGSGRRPAPGPPGGPSHQDHDESPPHRSQSPRGGGSGPVGAPSFQFQARVDGSSPQQFRDRGLEPTGPQPEGTRDPGRSGTIQFLERRWPLALTIGLALLLSAVIGIVLTAGFLQTSEIETLMSQAEQAQLPDTYEGFLSAELKLDEALEHESFLGSGFDRFLVETLPPVPGVAAPRLKRRAAAELAHVAAMLEYRFERPGAHEAGKRISYAREVAPGEPATAAAVAILGLIERKPHHGLTIAETAKKTFPEFVSADEARILVLLDLERGRDARKAAGPLEKLPSPDTFQQFLIARTEQAVGNRAALERFDKVLERSPDHVGARIYKSYLLRENDDELVAAKKLLEEVTSNLKRKASRYQIALATSAMGAYYLALGEEARAEDSLREAVRTMPERAKLYQPLLAFYTERGRYKDAQNYVTKARNEGAYGPEIRFVEARLLLIESKPKQALELLKEAEFADARKSWLMGRAYLDLDRFDEAQSAFEEAAEFSPPVDEARAFAELAGALENPEKRDAKLEALKKLRKKYPENPNVHWAAGLAHAADAERAGNWRERQKALTRARKAMEKAIDSRSDFPVFHFDLCRILLRAGEIKEAEKACKKGRDITEEYIPGLVVTARVRLREGRYDDALELLQTLRERRPDDQLAGLALIRGLIEARKFEKAEEEINRWLAGLGDTFELKLLEGRLEFARNNYIRASGYLKSAHEMRPYDAEAALFYAYNLARLGEYDKSDDILLDLLSEPEWGPYAWMALGEVRREQRKFKDAFQNLSKAEGQMRDRVVPPRLWSQVYTHRALTYKKKYNWNHTWVARYLKRAREDGDAMDPDLNYARARFFLGKRRENVSAAIDALEKVVEVAPYRCDAIETLSSLYRREEKEEKLEEIKAIEQKHCTDDSSGDGSSD